MSAEMNRQFNKRTASIIKLRSYLDERKMTPVHDHDSLMGGHWALEDKIIDVMDKIVRGEDDKI